jgi:hypothetical protein
MVACKSLPVSNAKMVVIVLMILLCLVCLPIACISSLPQVKTIRPMMGKTVSIPQYDKVGVVTDFERAWGSDDIDWKLKVRLYDEIVDKHGNTYKRFHEQWFFENEVVLCPTSKPMQE